MEPADSQMRLKLILGKFRVVQRDATHMKIALGGSTTMTVTVADYMDVNAGDIITLYTEVLYANPKPTSIQ